MDILLTSFGLGGSKQSLSAFTSTPPALFYRMPPVSMRLLNRAFMPDYAVLLLCDKIIMDGISFEALMEQPNELYRVVAETLRALNCAGFLELVDFGEVLRNKQILIEEMINYDLTILDSWIGPMIESAEDWLNFTREMPFSLGIEDNESVRIWASTLHDTVVQDASVALLKLRMAHALQGAHLDNDLREEVGYILRRFLVYVDANIVLSNELRIGFHDWSDFLPFYRRKFLSVGGKPEVPRQAAALNQLFDISFPEYAITDTKTFMRVIQDKRVEELRQLVQDAVDGTVIFDANFARSAFKEVLATERQITRYRNIASYLTMPLDLLGFVPGVGALIEKGVDEIAGKLIEDKLKEKYRWFYLLSDATEKRQRVSSPKNRNLAKRE